MKLTSTNTVVQKSTINPAGVRTFDDGSARALAQAGQIAAQIGNVQARGNEMAGQAFGALGRTVGQIGAVIQRQQEEQDTVNAQAANNEYTRRVNELMYNQEDGLMNTKFDGASGITDKFQEQEKKIREEVYGQYKFRTAKGQMAYNNLADRSAASRYELVRKHQTQQYEAYKDVTLQNTVDINAQMAANNYTSPDIVADSIAQAVTATQARFFGQGDEVVKRQSRKVAGDVATATINYALKDGDLQSASELLNRYAGVIDANKLPGIISTIRAQREDNFMIEKARELARSGLKGADLEAAIDGMQMPGVTGSFDNLKKSMDATLGQPYKLGTAGGSGSWDCGLWTQTMLNNNGENIQVRTADGQYAQMEREGRAFKDSSKLKPGDLVFWHTTDRWKYTDNPNAGADEAYKGISHVGIYMGNGKVRQAGGSGVSDIGLNDYEVIGFGRTAIGSAPQGRNLDATQRMRLESMVMSERQKMKRIEAEQQDEMINSAQEMFRAAGPNADPEAIAQEVAGGDVKMKNSILDMLTAAKYKIDQKGIDDASMNEVFNMIKDGQFDSLSNAIRFVQVPYRKANTKQIDQIKKWYEQKLNLEGPFQYKNLDKYISAVVGNEKDQWAKVARTTRLRNHAANFINEYRSKHNGNDPSEEELQAALSKDVTETKLVATTYEGQRYVYNQLMLPKDVLSAEPISEGMMRVRYRDADNDYGSREVMMPTSRFAEQMGWEENNSWLGF